MFDAQQFKDICTMQATANDLMSDDWRKSTNEQIPYYRAAYKEVAESLDHLGWKWWKKTEPNYDQAFLEIIDAQHFGVSEYIRQGTIGEEEFLESLHFLPSIEGEETISPYFEEAENFMWGCIENKFTSLLDWTYLVHAWNKTYPEHAKTFDEIFEIYLAKNTLNIFRTKNGQREGNYYKMWSGEEDNVHLHSFMERLKLKNELSFNNLYVMLEGYYKGMSDDQKAKG